MSYASNLDGNLAALAEYEREEAKASEARDRWEAEHEVGYCQHCREHIYDDENYGHERAEMDEDGYWVCPYCEEVLT